MDQHLLQGWQADPFGLHEQRYFSGGRPTKLVRDGRVEAYDQPPAQQESTGGIAVAASVPAAAMGVTTDGLWLSAAPAGAPNADDDQPGTAGSDAAPAGQSRPHRGVPGRSRRSGLVNTVVALVAVAAVVAFVVIEGGFSPKHSPKSHAGSGATGANLDAFVTSAARATLAKKTADVSLTGTTEINGSRVSLRGNGQVDLATNTSSFTLNTSYSGSSFAESEIMTSHAMYLQLTVNGQNFAEYLGGKHWMEIPLPGSATQSNAPQDSPAWSLQLLEQQGAKVVPLGSQTIGGLACSGYAVTPSQQAVLAAAQQEWAQLGLSTSETATARQLLENSTPPTISVWLDPTRQLACELDIAMQLGTGTSAGSGSAPATESIQMGLTFTHYGVPVDIAVPASSDTVTF